MKELQKFLDYAHSTYHAIAYLGDTLKNAGYFVFALDKNVEEAEGNLLPIQANITNKDSLENALKTLDGEECGTVLRAKGIVQTEGGWLAFDFVPESYEIRPSEPNVTGKICVIGSNLNKQKLEELF